MKRSDLKQLIKEVITEESNPHPYSQSVSDIASHIVAKAARIRDEYHIPYETALNTMIKQIQNEANKLQEPKENFPA